MKAEIIAVGTEILTGQILNTNAQFLSEKLAELGIDVYFQTAVGDNHERLLSVLEIASGRSDLVVLCGGLGPTDDDLTKQTLAQFLARDLVTDPQASQKLDNFFAQRPASSRTPNNDRQAQLVAGSQALANPNGLAVGGMLTVNQVTYVVLPGPPSELKAMVQEELLPRLSPQGRLYSRVLRFFGIGESRLVTILDDVIKQQTDPTLAPYAKTGEVTLRLSTKASDESLAQAKLDALEQLILSRERLADYFYGYGEDHSLAKEVADLLKTREQTLAAAESLTAGLFQSSLAQFSGASSYLVGGFVAYSMAAKANLLEIPLQDLEEHGVVSAFTAEKMAEQARLKLGTSLGVSLTGVAGPDSLEGQPLGRVYIGIANAQQTRSYQVDIGKRSRQDIRQIAVLHALDLVRRTLLSP
ncbi:competence/damage-inducible protein A [Streptococcus cuniculipharyngis]|uniref:Putative competence-damage inducible protein n=1 Tax=Streptococcus cuniculipharyngis TaxID=1562651 RepID=A0A5C5S9E9_9STRE|nr:competence/damage-inducible protein A [Streptococcus cuniculipharyngis]TWS97136.1 competence/damage-inducible protein A [Streptococcus cuniculipharyngis]